MKYIFKGHCNTPEDLGGLIDDISCRHSLTSIYELSPPLSQTNVIFNIFSGLGSHDDSKLYSSAAAAAAAAAASAVPEVASVLSPSQLVGYPGLQKSPVSGSGSVVDPAEAAVFCPATSAAAAAAAAFSGFSYANECSGLKTEDTTKDN